MLISIVLFCYFKVQSHNNCSDLFLCISEIIKLIVKLNKPFLNSVDFLSVSIIEHTSNLWSFRFLKLHFITMSFINSSVYGTSKKLARSVICFFGSWKIYWYTKKKLWLCCCYIFSSIVTYVCHLPTGTKI